MFSILGIATWTLRENLLDCIERQVVETGGGGGRMWHRGNQQMKKIKDIPKDSKVQEVFWMVVGNKAWCADLENWQKKIAKVSSSLRLRYPGLNWSSVFSLNGGIEVGAQIFSITFQLLLMDISHNQIRKCFAKLWLCGISDYDDKPWLSTWLVLESLWRHTSICVCEAVLERWTEERRSDLNVDGDISLVGVLGWIKTRNQGELKQSPLYVLDCECNVSSCIMLLLARLPCHDGPHLFLSHESEQTLYSLNNQYTARQNQKTLVINRVKKKDCKSLYVFICCMYHLRRTMLLAATELLRKVQFFFFFIFSLSSAALFSS